MAKKSFWILGSVAVAAISVGAALVFAPGWFSLANSTKTASATKPSATTPADPTALTDQNEIFNPAQVNAIQLDVPPKSQKALISAYSTVYVPATFQITVGNRQSPKMDVQIKIKGTTSRYGINTTYQYTSFKVKFDFDKQHKNQTLLGLKSLTLNAMTQDSSKIHETFAYDTYRAMGIPASRTGYAHLTMSSNIPHPDRGLYVVIESLDDVFLGRNFKDVTQHLYENGKNFTEITPANVGGNVKDNLGFQVKVGWSATPNRNDLSTFAKGIQASGKKLWGFLGTNSDRNKLVMQFAVDNFTGGWDTYSGPIKNNYQIRSDLQGRMTFIPWGLDNTWGENYFNDIQGSKWVKNYNLPAIYHDDFFFPVDSASASFPGGFMIAYSNGVTDPAKMTNYQFGRGQLFQKCLSYSTCSTLYFQDLQKVSDWATSSKLSDRMKVTSQMVAPYVTAFDKAEAVRVQAWVGKQQVKVAAAIKRHCKLDSANLISTCR